jgi:N-methylhydantoinase A
MRIGVDTGGTFTDFVLIDAGGLRTHKVLSTPAAPERAILQGLRELGVDLQRAAIVLVHGTTVATNAVLEGKTARTVFITNRGFGDLLSIGRQARRELYNFQPAPVAPPVPPALCLETGGRLGADGAIVEPLTDDDLKVLCETLQRAQPQAVAIALLFSYLDDAAERRIAAIVPDGVFVSRSAQVLPEIREYERGVATWLNAAVGPVMHGYLGRLCDSAGRARVAVMQSAGGSIEAQQAGDQAVRLLLSGPAGGLAGARAVAAQSGCTRLLSFDMGGTSTDVALIDGEPRLTSEGRIGPYPVAVPMVDMHTIGAGGGSIAYVDAGGLLQVGPQSAGAHPGPACYGFGATAPTVTDANLLLGRIDPARFLGGRMTLDSAAAKRALQGLAQALGMSSAAAAEGVIRIANEHMARALRVVSVQRGVDPREFTLVSFGGAGGLHVCALADALMMRDALVPVHGGVLSALGMLAAPPLRDLSRTLTGLLESLDAEQIGEIFAALEADGRRALQREGVNPQEIQVRRSADLRYRGQSFTLDLLWQKPAQLTEAFHAAHERQYGHRLNQPVELVNLRVRVRGPEPPLPRLRPGTESESTAPPAPEMSKGMPMYDRAGLPRGFRISGPALISEAVATTYVAPGWQAEVDAAGNLRLSR